MRTCTTTSRKGLLSAGETHSLAANATLRLRRGRLPVVVAVDRGTVLVTREGDAEDHVLEQGAILVLPGDGRVVAWAFTDAAVTVRDVLVPDRALRDQPASSAGAHRSGGVRRRDAELGGHAAA